MWKNNSDIKLSGNSKFKACCSIWNMWKTNSDIGLRGNSRLKACCSIGNIWKNNSDIGLWVTQSSKPAVRFEIYERTVLI